MCVVYGNSSTSEVNVKLICGVMGGKIAKNWRHGWGVRECRSLEGVGVCRGQRNYLFYTPSVHVNTSYIF